MGSSVTISQHVSGKPLCLAQPVVLQLGPWTSLCGVPARYHTNSGLLKDQKNWQTRIVLLQQVYIARASAPQGG
jgi:hypothetical protein